MKMRALACLGIGVAGLVACEPPAKMPSPAPTAAVVEKPAQPVVSAAAASSASAESVPAHPMASASAASPAFPPCPPEVPEPADGLAWVSGCRIVIRQKIVFDIEKATIKRESFPVIDAVGDILFRNPDISVEIEGHLGEARRHYSRMLSKDRAESVRKYLIVKKGVPPEQLTAKGYEDSKPIFDYRTEEGRAKNRRIEFVILSWRGQIR